VDSTVNPPLCFISLGEANTTRGLTKDGTQADINKNIPLAEPSFRKAGQDNGRTYVKERIYDKHPLCDRRDEGIRIQLSIGRICGKDDRNCAYNSYRNSDNISLKERTSMLKCKTSRSVERTLRKLSFNIIGANTQFAIRANLEAIRVGACTVR
jgi:hypothetical protein